MDALDTNVEAVLSEQPPYHQGLEVMLAASDVGASWTMKAEFRKDAEGYTIFKMKVTSDRERGAEPPTERQIRMLCQGLLNLARYDQIRWVEHAVDPESGEVLIDTLIIPSQWHRLDGTVSPEPSSQRGEYTVVFTPSGCRCNCPYAERTPTPAEDTPWGMQPSGSTVACPHSELAKWVMHHDLCARPRA